MAFSPNAYLCSRFEVRDDDHGQAGLERNPSIEVQLLSVSLSLFGSNIDMKRKYDDGNDGSNHHCGNKVESLQCTFSLSVGEHRANFCRAQYRTDA